MRQDSFLQQPEPVQPDVWLLPRFTSAAALWDDLLAVSAAARRPAAPPARASGRVGGSAA